MVQGSCQQFFSEIRFQNKVSNFFRWSISSFGFQRIWSVSKGLVVFKGSGRFLKDRFVFKGSGRFSKDQVVFKGFDQFRLGALSFPLQQYKDANAFTFTIAYSIFGVKPSIFGIKRTLNDYMNE
jgi:hypothetical protein